MLERILQLPLVRQLHTRSLLFPTLVSLAVAVVLVHGALRKPVPQAASAEAGRETLSLPSIRPSLEKTPLSYFSDYWLQVARQTRRKLRLIGQDKTPAIVVAPGIAVSSVAAGEDAFAAEMLQRLRESRDEGKEQPADADNATTDEAAATSEVPTTTLKTGVSEEQAQDRYRLLGIDAEMGLALFELQRPYLASAFAWADPLDVQPGSYAAAISLSPEGVLRITPGVVVSRPRLNTVQSYSLDVSIPFPEHIDVAAIIDLDGSLLGVAVASGSSIKAFSAEAIHGVIGRIRDHALCQSVEVADIGGDVRDILRIQRGIVVEKVRDALLGDPAIHPGDILLEWAGEAVETAAEFQQIYQEQQPGSTVGYTILRGAKRLRGKARMPRPACLPGTESMVPFARLGLVVEWKSMAVDQGTAQEGWMVSGVLDGSPAAAGGLTRGDWIVAAQGRPLRAQDLRPFERYESRPQPMVLVVRRGDRTRLLAIQLPENTIPAPDSSTGQS